MGIDPFIGQIQPFAGSYAPRGWALCHGQVITIVDYEALYAIIGTRYGGDGRSTFGLPDLRSRVVVGAGQGHGLTYRPLASAGGSDSVGLNELTLAGHTHQAEISASLDWYALPTKGDHATPQHGDAIAASYSPGYDAPIQWYGPKGSSTAALQGAQMVATATVTPTGGGQAHTNMQPFTAINYIIALEGVFPPRT